MNEGKLVSFGQKLGRIVRDERDCYFIRFADSTMCYVLKTDTVLLCFATELERLAQQVIKNEQDNPSDRTDEQAQLLTLLMNLSSA